ncbi:MAG: translocation/assembly module TamB domain-containing protein [Deltaproteobacteria bacterium]|jgi:translocation and assembly module TamB|nr:translocation/assembly module TamB domain-containing protein [Deltaproteobacteria bacterium]
MTGETPKLEKEKVRKPLLRRGLKALLWLGIILLVALVAGFLYLRSDSGLRLVLSETKEALAKQGIGLSYGSAKGPLPSRLTLTDLRLSDQEGTFLTCSELELSLSPSKLISRTVDVGLLRLQGLDFIRPPKLPPGGPGKGEPFTGLPVSVKVRLKVEDSKVLSSFQGEGNQSILNLSGYLAYLMDDGLSFDLSGLWAPPGANGLSLETRLDADSLFLDLALTMSQGGPLEWLSKDLGLPWGEPLLLVKAAGPLEGLAGTLSLTDLSPHLAPMDSKDDAGPKGATPQGSSVQESGGGATAQANLMGVTGDFLLSSEQGTTFQGLIRDPGLAKSLTLSLKSSKGFPLPKGVGDIVGGEPSLMAELGRRDKEAFSGKVAFFSEKFETALSPVDLSFADGKLALSADGTFALRPHGLPDDLPDALPSGNTPAGGSASLSPMPIPMPMQMPLIVPASYQGNPLPMLVPASAGDDYGAGTLYAAKDPKKGAAKEPEKGAAKEPEKDAGKDPAKDHEKAPVKEASKDPVKDMAPLEGDLRLRLELGKGTVLVKTLDVAGEGMDLSLTGTFGGMQGKSDALLGLRLQKGERFTKFLPGLPQGVGSDASLDLSLAYDGESQSIGKGNLKLDLAELSGLAPGLSGGVKVGLEADGKIQEDLGARLTLTSDKLTRSGPQGTIDFHSPELSFDGRVKALGTDPSIDGKLRLLAKNEDGTQLASLSSDPKLAFGKGGFQGSLDSLLFEGLGATLTADKVSIALKDGGMPELNGDLDVAVTSYDDLRALSGLDLKGEPLTLRLSLANEQGKQLAKGSLRNDSISVGPAKASKTSLDFDLSDPFSEPSLSMELATGQGSAPMFSWTNGTVSVSKPGPDGNSKIAVSIKEQGGRDLLSVNGNYNPEKGILALDAFRFTPPKLRDQVVLQSPVRITFGAAAKSPAAGTQPAAIAPAQPGATGSAAVTPENPPVARDITVSGLDLSLGKARIRLAGKLSPLDASLEVRDLPYSALATLTDSFFPDGSINLKADYKENGSGAFTLQTDPSLKRVHGPPLAFKVDIKGELSGNFLAGDGKIVLPGPAGRTPLNIQYKVPMSRRGGYPMPDMGGPLSASMDWAGDIAYLWGFMTFPDRQLKGNTSIKASVGGTLDKPIPSAEVFLANSTYDDQVLNLYLGNINLSMTADEREGKLRVLADASDGNKGTLALEGNVTLGASPTLEARGQINRLAPFHRDDFNVTLSALFSISGPFSDLTITTKAVVESMEINLASSIGGPSVATLTIDEGFQQSSQGVRLDLTLDIPRGAYIRGRGLDSEWKGNLHVTGTSGEPLINGILSPIRGYFTLLGKEFTFSGGGITFRNNRRLNPGLDIELHRNVTNLTAIVRVQGTLSAPRLRFESNPPYPQDEVLAQVLFGKPASELSRFETIQVANSLRELAGVGSKIPNPLGAMREALGLSVLRIGEASSNSDRHMEGNEFRENLGLDDQAAAKADTAPTIEAGKYITDNIYVGVDQNLVDNSTGIRVEIELTPSVNIVSRTSDTSSRVGIGWKKDY